MGPIFLRNHIPTFILPTDGTDAVTVLVLVKVGSRYETAPLNGASHFIEHMMFKGTKRRPNAKMISQTLDGVGADYNAYTGKDVTGYWIKVDRMHLPLAVDVLSDMLRGSVFAPAEMKRERRVIIEEINMYQDNPLMHIEDMIESAMFEGSTLGWEIAGSHKTMTEMSRADVVAYRNAYYTADRMVLAVSGACEKSQTHKLLQKAFGPVPTHSKNATPFAPISPRQRVNTLIQEKKTDQVQVALGWRGISHTDARLPAMKLLSVILGGPMSSRLFLSVRERQGLCYSIRASHGAFEDTGAFVVQSGLDRSRVPLAGRIIMKEVRRIMKERVEAKELARAKEYICGKTTLALEDSSERAEWFAKQYLYKGRALTPAEALTRYRKVSAKEVQEAANMVFSQPMSVAGIGPFKDAKTLRSYFR